MGIDFLWEFFSQGRKIIRSIFIDYPFPLNNRIFLIEFQRVETIALISFLLLA